MIPEYKTKTNIGIGLGIIFQLTGRYLMGSSDTGTIAGLVLVLIGAVCFIWGCMNYAAGKGHSKVLGLLGLLSCLGLIILIFLPDRHK